MLLTPVFYLRPCKSQVFIHRYRKNRHKFVNTYFRQAKKMSKEKLASEKIPVLNSNTSPFDYDNQREKFVCKRSTLSWILASALLILFILVTILFLYPSYDQRILVREEPIEVRMIPPRLEDAVDGENHPENNVNPWDFEFLINPVNLCTTINPPNSVEYQINPEVKLLILVPSAADHFEERRAIRSTWGSVAERPLGPVRLGFVLDNDYRTVSNNKTISELIHQESSQFKDIIQIDFVESFQSLATKSILMLKWVAKMCPHAQYFLKTEDDTFVNIRSIADILNKEPYTSQDRFIAGHVKRIEPSLKLPLTEIHLNLDDYLLDDFPPYAASSYVMSIPTAIDLFGATKEVEPLFPEDDAFLTGACAKHIDVPLIHEPSFIIENPPMPPLWDTYSTLTTAHSVPPDALKQVWKDMTKSISNSMHYFETAINTTGSFRRKKSV